MQEGTIGTETMCQENHWAWILRESRPHQIPRAPPPMMGFNGMMTAPEPPYQKTPKHPIVYAPLPGMKTTQLYLHE